MSIRFTHQDTDLFCKQVIRLVDPLIKEILNLSVDENRQRLVNYQVASGGKRLRPALAIASCLACGGEVEDALYPAAGLEILHNCTLIYDDMIDNSSLRRAKSTVWYKFGKSVAQCIGVDYSAAIFQAANRSRYPIEICEIFARTMKTVAEGEILDILFEQRGRDDEKYVVSHRYREVTREDYLQMISQKTASLVQASCEVGAISAGAEEIKIEALKRYGFSLGLAFQITDDILDIFGEEQEFGKKIGNDIEASKLGNIVILQALEELGSGGKHKELSAILSKNNIEDRDIQRAIKVISKTGAKENSLLLQEEYVTKAKSSLHEIPGNKWTELLARMADFVIERNR